MRCRVRIASVAVAVERLLRERGIACARVARGGSIPRARRFGDAPDAIARRVAAPRRRGPDGARSLPRAWAIREVASGRRRRTSARIPSGRRRRTSARIPSVVPRVPPTLSGNAASGPSLRRCASSTVSGRGHVVQAPRASVIATKRPVELIPNSLDVGDQRRGGSGARLVPHHARVHVRVPLVSRRGRVGHDAELMGSLRNATGAIEGSKHGLHATRAGTVRRGRNRAPGEFGDLVLSTSDADADDGAARGSERVQGVLRVAGDARGVRGGGGGVRGTVGARRAQLLHLRAREEDGRRVLERRGTRTIVRGVRVPRGGSSARVRRETRVVRARGSALARDRRRRPGPDRGSGAEGWSRNRSLDEAGGARPRRQSVCDRPERAEARRGARGCVRTPRPPRPWSPRPPRPPRPPSRSPRPRAPRPPSRASPARSRRWSFEGDRPRGGDRSRSRSRLRLRLARRARSGRRSASSSSSSSTTSTVGYLRARRWASSSAPASASSAGASSRPSRRGEPSLRRSSGTPASTSLPASAGLTGDSGVSRWAGSPPPRVIIRARGIGEPVARVVAHIQRARPHQATISDPRSVRRTLSFDETERRARDQWRRRAPRGRLDASSARGRSEAPADDVRRHEGFSRQTHYARAASSGKWRETEGLRIDEFGRRRVASLSSPRESCRYQRPNTARLVRTSPFRPRSSRPNISVPSAVSLRADASSSRRTPRPSPREGKKFVAFTVSPVPSPRRRRAPRFFSSPPPSPLPSTAHERSVRGCARRVV